MKHSLRVTITMIFIGIMVMVMTMMFLINMYLLDSYYTNQKVRELENAYETLDRIVTLYEKNGSTIFDTFSTEYGKNVMDSPVISIFRTLNDRSNINIVIIDKENNTMAVSSRESAWMEAKLRLYDTFEEDILNGIQPQIPMPKPRTLPEETRSGSGIAETAEDSTKNGEGQKTGRSSRSNPESGQVVIVKDNGNYHIQKIFDSRSESGYLESWGHFSNSGMIFLMSMPLQSIRESVGITNRFLLYVGGSLLLVGAVIIYFVTGMITKPVNQLAAISRKMSEQDFSVKYTGTQENEIGILGRSMNIMAEKLERTIAELKTANNKLQQDIVKKEKIDEMRTDFIANISHELKTPISLIEGYAEGLVEGIAEDKESRDYYCGVIMDEASKMNALVRQLTSLNDLEFGHDAPEMTRFDLCALIRNVADCQKLKLEEKGAALTLSLPERCFVWADEFKCEEVVVNYLTNAVNHVSGENKIEISVKAGEKTARVRVFNSGENIPVEDLSRIWEKFYKVDKARTRAYGGSGIGLSIVKSIMNAHHMAYGVENKPGGVEFFAEFELAGA